VAFAPTTEHTGTASISRTYAWIVFALVFGLLLSDYMSRQVLNSVFGMLKAEWSLTDTQLGSLAGVVSVMVGLLTIPLSIAADRWGRVASLKVMALLWCFATLACGFARSYEEMFLARFMIGVGEAAYGSVGIAVILSVFPPHLRSTLAGSFLAGGVFGSVMGMAIGGAVAAKLGWRYSFFAMAAFGLVVLAIFALVVTESRIDPERRKAAAAPQPRGTLALRGLLPGLFSARSVIFAYLGNGLQLFIVGALIAWMPTFLSREYGLATDRAAASAAVFVLLSGVGMIVCGTLTDRLCARAPARKFAIAVGLAVATCVLLLIAFRLPPGTPQLAFLAAGALLSAGTTGPSTAMVANVTHVSIHSTAFAVLSLANNLLGMAPGPIVTGVIADRAGLVTAFQWLPLVCLLAALAFALGRRGGPPARADRGDCRLRQPAARKPRRGHRRDRRQGHRARQPQGDLGRPRRLRPRAGRARRARPGPARRRRDEPAPGRVPRRPAPAPDAPARAAGA
jgi:MFS family permease